MPSWLWTTRWPRSAKRVRISSASSTVSDVPSAASTGVMVPPASWIAMRWLRKELERVNGELERAVKESPVWNERAELLMGVPGVGPTLSATLLAELPELEHLDRRRLAALVGVVAGKPKKVALTACMRKPLTSLAAVLRNRTPRRTETIVA